MQSHSPPSGLKGQNNKAQWQRPGSPVATPCVLNVGSPLAPTPMSVIEIELTIIWIAFRDSAISAARNSRLFIPIATNPTINAIATHKSKPMPVKAGKNAPAIPASSWPVPTSIARIRLGAHPPIRLPPNSRIGAFSLD